MTREEKQKYKLLADLLHWAVHEQFCLGASDENELRAAMVVMLHDMAAVIGERITEPTECPSKR